MNACSDAQAVIEDYVEELRYGIEELTAPIIFGRHLCDTEQYDKAQKYFEHLLIDSDGEDLVWIEHYTGLALHKKRGHWMLL